MQNKYSSNIQFSEQGQLKHLLSIEGLSQQQFIAILDKAEHSLRSDNYRSYQTPLRGKTIVNCFFEPSTRTRCSFELAAKRLGAEVLNLDVPTSSTKKGESLLDTVHTLEAMHIDLLIIRHSESGICEFVAQNLKTNTRIINAGDGIHAHPTQALLDMLTIRQYKSNFKDLIVAIVGDIAHSRVARSDLQALQLLNTGEIRLIAPEPFFSDDLRRFKVKIFNDIDQGIRNTDVIIMLRIQHERLHQNEMFDAKAYFDQYGLTEQRLKLAKPDAIVMHPGPMNREIEISPEVADGKQSVILQQVRNGVAIRMAVMEILLA